MLKSIRLRNFKSYKDSADVSLAPLTVIVGANNSGKSTLLQSLLMLAQTIEDPSRASLVTSGTFVELNGFSDIVHGKVSGPQVFSIGLAADELEVTRMHERYGFTASKTAPVLADALDVSFGLAPKTREIQVHKAVFWANGKKLVEVNKDKKWTTEVFPDITPHKGKVLFQKFLPFVSFDAREDKKGEREFSRSVRLSYNIWSDILARVTRVGPLRSRVPWYCGVGARMSAGFGSGGANLVAALGSKELLRKTGLTRLGFVNDWMSNKFKILKELHVEDLDKSGTVRMLLGDEEGGTSNINVAAMGEGVSQILPIIAQAVGVAAADCLIVEQPEIHLHPKLQADLADLFIDVIQTGKRQVIVETHSEHMLLRLRRRVAEGKSIIPNTPPLTPEQIAILYVEKDGPVSTVRRLKLNGRGHFSDWPKDFFDEAYQDAMGLAAAASKREA